MRNSSPHHRTRHNFFTFGILLLLVLFFACDPLQEQDRTATESMTLIGPDSIYPAVRLLAGAYMKDHPADRIYFRASVHSTAGIAEVIDGTADMGIVSRQLTPEEGRNLLCCYPFALDFKISPLQINGVPSSPEPSGPKNKDRLRPYSFVVLGRPQGLARRFIDAVYNPEGQEILRKNGLLPEHRKLTLALIPKVNITAPETDYLPLIDYLSRKGRIPIEVKYTAGYGETVRNFRQGKIDGAFLGSFTYTLVKTRIPLEVLARPEIDGQSYYTGILFVRQDSGIRNLKDLRGKTFCFVDRASMAGYLFPLQHFREAGIVDDEAFFGKTFFAGSHNASILSVLNGEADAGAAKDLVLMKAGEKDTRIALDLLMMAGSAPIPTNGLCVRSSLDWDLKEDLKEILLHMEEDPEGRNVLKRIDADRFLPTADQDYENLYTLLDELKINPATFNYENP